MVSLSNNEVEATLNQWRNNDYYKEYRDNAWRTAVTQRYNVSVSQKVGKNNHFLSFNYENDKGRTINDKRNKFSLYYKSNYAITSWLNVNAGVDAVWEVAIHRIPCLPVTLCNNVMKE